MMTFSVVKPRDFGPSVETTARIFPWKRPAPSTAHRSDDPSNDTTGQSRLCEMTMLPAGLPSKSAAIGTPKAEAILPRAWSEGDTRPDTLSRHALADECRRGLLRRPRLGGDSAEHDASFTDHVALHPGRHGHPEHREIERAASPELQVHRAPALGRRQLDVGDDLVGTLGEVFDPVVLVERGHRHRALALRADYSQLRAERPEHRRGVRRGHGPAP